MLSAPGGRCPPRLRRLAVPVGARPRQPGGLCLLSAERRQRFGCDARRFQGARGGDRPAGRLFGHPAESATEVSLRSPTGSWRRSPSSPTSVSFEARAGDAPGGRVRGQGPRGAREDGVIRGSRSWHSGCCGADAGGRRTLVAARRCQGRGPNTERPRAARSRQHDPVLSEGGAPRHRRFIGSSGRGNATRGVTVVPSAWIGEPATERGC